ncbi:MAG: hypothetical protein ACI4L2_08925 [Wujia sp.]
MNIFDKYILQILDGCASEDRKRLAFTGNSLPIAQKNTFLMERDTAIELGGYPQESINLIVPSSKLPELTEQAERDESLMLEDGVYCIGNPKLLHGKEKHISFGKIVLLDTEHIPDDAWYNFTQSELLTDSKLWMKHVMLRQSPTHYNINLRVGKDAFQRGFDIQVLGETIYNAFRQMKYVKSVIVLLIVGESKLYKELLPIAEKIKEVTLTLNHIFDGIDMDCGHCDLSAVCNEVEAIRALHKRRNGAGNPAK